MERNNDLIIERDKTVRQLLDSMGELVNEGLTEVAAKRPQIAQNVVQLVEQGLGGLRITIDMLPKPTLKVCAVSFDGEMHQKLFTVSLIPITADSLGSIN
jgi:hypothetical protein